MEEPSGSVPEQMVPLGTLYNVHYIDEIGEHDFKDLHLISTNGNLHSLNRCVLASGSQVCCQMLNELYADPLANSDEFIYVSTNLDDDELATIINFLQNGLLPGSAQDEVDHSYSSVFAAFGIELQCLDYSPANDDDLERKGDPKFLNLHQGDYTDEFDCEEEVLSKPKAFKRKRLFKSELERQVLLDRKRARREARSLEGCDTDSRSRYFHFPQEGLRDLSKPYQCERCVRGFTNLYLYRQHFCRHDLGCEDFMKAFTCLRCFQYQCPTTKEVFDHGKYECKIKNHDDETSPVTYFCALCLVGFRVKTQELLKQHVQANHPERYQLLFHPHTCAACGKSWSSENILARHIRQEGQFHLAQCATCGKKVKSWDEHKMHVDQEHGGSFRYRCGICGHCIFDDRTEERNHRRVCKYVRSEGHFMVQVQPGQAGSASTTCSMCGIVVDPNKVREHLIDFHAEIHMKCPHCESVYFSDHDLKDHVRRVHGKKIPCDLCGQQFHSNFDLKKHNLSKHVSKEQRPFKCEVCGQGFVARHLLKYHSKVHMSVRPDLINQKRRVCEVCGTSVFEKQYKLHLKTQHGDGHIQCEKCDATFKHKTSYRRHFNRNHIFVTCEQCGEQIKGCNYKMHKLKRHTPETMKPYVCRICNPPKGFVTTYLFKEHNNIHTGERPFSCLFCSNTFKNSANKFKHMRETHKDLYKSHKQDKREQQQMTLQQHQIIQEQKAEQNLPIHHQHIPPQHLQMQPERKDLVPHQMLAIPERKAHPSGHNSLPLQMHYPTTMQDKTMKDHSMMYPAAMMEAAKKGMPMYPMHMQP